MKKIAIVIPSYNRLNNVLEFKEMATKLVDCAFFVCDNSTEAYNLTNSENFTYIYCGKSVGKAKAIDTLPNELLRDYEYIMEMDDDIITDSEKLNLLAANIGSNNDFYVIDHFDENGKIIGDEFRDGDSYINFYFNENKNGDKQYIVKREKWTKVKYNPFPGESFIPEDVKWVPLFGNSKINKIDGVFTKVKYDEGGVSSNIKKILSKNRTGATKSKALIINSVKLPFFRKIKNLLVYYVYSNRSIRKTFPLKRKSLFLFLTAFMLKPYYLKERK